MYQCISAASSYTGLKQIQLHESQPSIANHKDFDDIFDRFIFNLRISHNVGTVILRCKSIVIQDDSLPMRTLCELPRQLLSALNYTMRTLRSSHIFHTRRRKIFM